MVIDEFMPVFDVSKRYSIKVSAPVNNVYSALKDVNIYDSPLIRVLFFLRRLPAIFKSQNKGSTGNKLTISDISNSGFILLDEKCDDELVIGIVGKFWKLSGDIMPVSAKLFRSFNEKGFAKAAWNFSVRPMGQAVTELSTETRVQCTDESSRKKFIRYWKLIGPFSGVVRREMMKLIKRNAEKETCSK
ncbi:hypothetical protein JNL27_14535 [bacterium]|nr:hypothetical protein [bacterium]